MNEDRVHELADYIEHIQTFWEADRDEQIEPLAEFTARGLIREGWVSE